MSAGNLAVFARDLEEIEKGLRDLPEAAAAPLLDHMADTKEALEQMAQAEIALMASVARFEEWRHGEGCPGDTMNACSCGLTGLRIAILNARMALTTMQARFTNLMDEIKRLRGR